MFRRDGNPFNILKNVELTRPNSACFARNHTPWGKKKTNFKNPLDLLGEREREREKLGLTVWGGNFFCKKSYK